MNIRTALTTIVVVLLFTLLTIPAFAAVTPKPTAAMEETTIEATQATKTTYVLPYPGILTDHPLYFLKQLRDTIMERLIADPARKIEFYILQGDKSLNSGIFLDAKDKDALAGAAFVVSGKYMEKALVLAKEMKAGGREIPPYIIEHLTNSLAKHDEVLTELMVAARESQKQRLISAIEFVNTLQEEVTKLAD